MLVVVVVVVAIAILAIASMMTTVAWLRSVLNFLLVDNLASDVRYSPSSTTNTTTSTFGTRGGGRSRGEYAWRATSHARAAIVAHRLGIGHRVQVAAHLRLHRR